MKRVEIKSSDLLVPSAIIIASVIIAGAMYFSALEVRNALSTVSVASGGSSVAAGQGSQPQAPSVPVSITDVDINGEPFIGDPNAPVVLAYWLDFQCPFCRRFEEQTMPTLVEKYVNTGKLKIVFKDYQFLGPDSQDAGLVENAVWELYPEQYQAWHNAMYAAQDAENAGFGNLDSILALIRRELPSIDADRIASQVELQRTAYQQEIDADKSEGTQFGVNGTPGFIIGDQLISGAQPTAVFTQVIDAELSKAP